MLFCRRFFSLKSHVTLSGSLLLTNWKLFTHERGLY